MDWLKGPHPVASLWVFRRPTYGLTDLESDLQPFSRLRAMVASNAGIGEVYKRQLPYLDVSRGETFVVTDYQLMV